MGTRFAQPQAAEEVTLERCQIATGSPCVLIAVNDEIRGRVGAAPRRDMPRVRYAGAFLLDRTPGVQASGRQDNPALRDYATALAPRALVMHPWGRYFSAAAARNESEAERVALAACNADAERMGRDGPCFVYARGDRVVLPERRTAAR